MPFYKSPDNDVHFIDSEAFEYILKPGCIAISDAEAETLRRPAGLSANQIIINKIAALESSITDRRIRESVLGIDGGWLKDMNDQIADLRSKLA